MTDAEDCRRKAGPCRRLKLMALKSAIAELLDEMARKFDSRAAQRQSRRKV